MSIQKRYLIGGNWKCNGTSAQIKDIVGVLNAGGDYPEKSEVVIAIPLLHFKSTQALLERTDISFAAQDVGLNAMGAFTGEHSAEMLVDAGIKWTLTGHSERRMGFGGPGESSETVALKTARAIRAGLSVILCIGEQLTERESGVTMDVCRAQLEPVLAQLPSSEDWKKIVVAYEPVWAIGTGKVATPEQAEETHLQLRRYLAERLTVEAADALRIIYGGSVSGKSCAGLIACPNIDGFLVGGASLKPEFVDIIKCSHSA
jgi:triosephosphate isomerase